MVALIALLIAGCAPAALGTDTAAFSADDKTFRCSCICNGFYQYDNGIKDQKTCAAGEGISCTDPNGKTGNTTFCHLESVSTTTATPAEQ